MWVWPRTRASGDGVSGATAFTGWLGATGALTLKLNQLGATPATLAGVANLNCCADSRMSVLIEPATVARKKF